LIQAPDVAGLPVARAEALLRETGFSVVMRRTSPPWPTSAPGQGSGHVVSQSYLAPDTVELLVADEAPERIDRQIPRHIAFICDGNGRWATARGLTRHQGHRAGTDNVKRVVEWCAELGVGYVTFYAFSTENWRRPADEVRGLMDMIVEGTRTAMKDLVKAGVRVNVLGDRSALPSAVQLAIRQVCEATRTASKMQVNLLLNYGGRADVVGAAQQLAQRVADGELLPADINEAVFAAHLWTGGQPDPDLIIRTAGDLRLSNFLLWQGAYSELHFTPVYWPAFGRGDLLAAIDDYTRRQRRFGGLTEKEV